MNKTQITYRLQKKYGADGWVFCQEFSYKQEHVARRTVEAMRKKEPDSPFRIVRFTSLVEVLAN